MTGDEIMGKVQHQFREAKMDFKTRNSSKKKATYLRISVDTGAAFFTHAARKTHSMFTAAMIMDSARHYAITGSLHHHRRQHNHQDVRVLSRKLA